MEITPTRYTECATRNVALAGHFTGRGEHLLSQYVEVTVVMRIEDGPSLLAYVDGPYYRPTSIRVTLVDGELKELDWNGRMLKKNGEMGDRPHRADCCARSLTSASPDFLHEAVRIAQSTLTEQAATR